MCSLAQQLRKSTIKKSVAVAAPKFVFRTKLKIGRGKGSCFYYFGTVFQDFNGHMRVETHVAFVCQSLWHCIFSCSACQRQFSCLFAWPSVGGGEYTLMQRKSGPPRLRHLTSDLQVFRLDWKVHGFPGQFLPCRSENTKLFTTKNSRAFHWRQFRKGFLVCCSFRFFFARESLGIRFEEDAHARLTASLFFIVFHREPSNALLSRRLEPFRDEPFRDSWEDSLRAFEQLCSGALWAREQQRFIQCTKQHATFAATLSTIDHHSAMHICTIVWMSRNFPCAFLVDVAASAAAGASLDVIKLDLRVGKILSAELHPTDPEKYIRVHLFFFRVDLFWRVNKLNHQWETYTWGVHIPLFVSVAAKSLRNR